MIARSAQSALNTGDPARRAVAGGAGAPLSKPQIRSLILAALAAHREQARLGLWDAQADGGFDAFRHAAAWESCRIASFKALRQRHYEAVLARLRALAGDERGAARAQRRAAGDDTRRALHALDGECRRLAGAFGGVEGARSYAAALARRIHHGSLAELSARQTWQVLFTLRNRAASKRRQT